MQREVLKSIALGVAVIFGGCQASASAELDRICRISAEPMYAPLPPHVRAQRYWERVDAELTNLDVKSVWGTLAGADPASRYPMMQRAAAEFGVPHWQCPSFDRLWTAGVETVPPHGEPASTSH